MTEELWIGTGELGVPYMFIDIFKETNQIFSGSIDYILCEKKLVQRLQKAKRYYTRPPNFDPSWNNPCPLEVAVWESSLKSAPYKSLEQAKNIIQQTRLELEEQNY